MNDTPNPDDFSVNERAREFRATISVSGAMSLTIDAGSEDEAQEKAEALIDQMENEERPVELDMVYDIGLDYVVKVNPLFRATRDGRKMQVSRLEPGDLPREPDEHGF